ncbi:hypothetical protein ACLOJK_025409 [Asimina triloba]
MRRKFLLNAFAAFAAQNKRKPARVTQEKQVQLWKELILDYCRSQKIFATGVEEDFLLFANPVMEGNSSSSGSDIADTMSYIEELRAMKLGRCSFQHWCQKVERNGWIKDTRNALFSGTTFKTGQITSYILLEDGVMTVEEIHSGIESRGTGLFPSERTPPSEIRVAPIQISAPDQFTMKPPLFKEYASINMYCRSTILWCSIFPQRGCHGTHRWRRCDRTIRSDQNDGDDEMILQPSSMINPTASIPPSTAAKRPWRSLPHHRPVAPIPSYNGGHGERRAEQQGDGEI